MRFGPFTADPLRRQVTREGQPVHLTPKAFDLLLLLIGQAPRVVPKTELHERLWPGTFVTDSTLVGVIKELRRALGDDDPDRPIIRTAHRVGYAFSLPLEGTAPTASTIFHWVVVQGRRIPLGRGENIIGRDPTSAVHLDSAGVSRRHAKIVVDDERVTVEDLGSKNGTRLADSRLTGPAALHDGDHIHIGSIAVLYRASSSGMSTETQVATHERPVQ